MRLGKKLVKKKSKTSDEYSRLLDSVYRLISRRPRTKAEIEKYLHGKHASAGVCRKIIEKLEKNNYLNDKEFSRWWLEQRQAFRPKGKLALKAELRQKGVDEETIRGVLEAGVDEVSLAQKALQKKASTFAKLPRKNQHQKMFSFLGQKGFSYETIKTVLDELEKKE